MQPLGANPVWPLAPQSGGSLAQPYAWAGPAPAPGAAEFNLAALLRILSEWRWLILGCVAIGLAAATTVTLLTTPQYRASVVLEINPPSVQLMENSQAKSGAGGDDKQFLATQYGLLESRSLAQRVAQELNLASNPELVPQETDRRTRQQIATGVLMQGVEVKPTPASNLVTLSFSSPSAELSARVANSFADSFINSNLERRYEASSYARDFLQRQIAKVKTELEASERQLVAYAQRQGIINTGSEDSGGDANSLQGASLVSLNAALAAAQTRRIAAEQRYRQAASMGNSAEVNESTAAMRQQRATLEAEYQEKLNAFKPEYPEMVRLRSRIDAIDQQIRREVSTVAGGRSTSLLADYRAAAAEERSLQARVNQLKSAVLNLRGRSIEYNILQREVDTNRTLYDALLQRYKEIGVAGGIGTNLVSVVDRAEPPGGPYKPDLMLNLLIGLIAGLVAGVAAAFALEFINDTIKTPDDVRGKLGLASLGVVPKKASQKSMAEELSDQTSPISEAYFSLRTSLQFSTDHGVPKSLLVTSTRAAEGKSSTTLALAQNFARLGKRVILMDGDLRKPAFKTDVDPEHGFSKLLTNQELLEEHVLKTDTEMLWLLPCGALPPNPAELLASPRLAHLVAEATKQFDLVIIDGPPVLGLADAPLLGAVCEATMLVIESGKTRTRAAADASNRLKASGSHIIGAVLTKFRRPGVGYGYGYNYEPYRYGGVSSRERDIQLITHREG